MELLLTILFVIPLYLMYKDAIRDEKNMELQKPIDICGKFAIRFIYTFCIISIALILFLILEQTWLYLIT